MSGRGPDPKALRQSLVDSGWSTAPPPAEAANIRSTLNSSDLVSDADIRSTLNSSDLVSEPDIDIDIDARRLPNYEDLPQAPAVTQVDLDIQARLLQMQRGSLADQHRPALPDVSRAPSSLPPPPSFPPPSLPPPPPPPAAPPARALATPLPSFAAPSTPDLDLPPPPLAPYRASLRGSDSDPAEATEIMEVRGAVLPPSDPPELRTASLLPAPSLVAALRQRVRFAGGEVPLWSLLAPMVLLLSLASAFVAAALGGSGERETQAATDETAPSPSAAPLPSTLASALAEPARAPEPTATTQAPALPASATDTEALEARRAEELTKDEALALAAARRTREVAQIVLLRQKLKRDPGLFKDAALMTELRRAAEDPLTAPDALSAMAEAPGPLSADLLYEMWTGTVARNSATELARSLVFSKEVRAKASPELAIALDLRIAETCEQNRELLPRVLEKADRRSLSLLAKLARRYGCGPNKRVDCYACLREDKAVEDAMAAVKKRREPKPFLGK
jgi:hypothetical protein